MKQFNMVGTMYKDLGCTSYEEDGGICLQVWLQVGSGSIIYSTEMFSKEVWSIMSPTVMLAVINKHIHKLKAATLEAI